MRFGMSVNMNIPDAPRMAKRTLELLKGHEVLLEKEMAERFKTKGHRLEDMDVDMMVTVGGDGTILRALQHNKLRFSASTPGTSVSSPWPRKRSWRRGSRTSCAGITNWRNVLSCRPPWAGSACWTP